MIDYTYTINNQNTAEKYLSIRYEAEGHPTAFKNFRCHDFSLENISRLAKEGADYIIEEIWSKYDNPIPSEVSINQTFSATYKSTIISDKPVYDKYTSKLVENRSEDSNSIYVSWDQIPLTAQEMEEALIKGREEKRQVLRLNRDIDIAEPIDNIQVDHLIHRENITGAINNWEILGNPSSISWIKADNSIAQMSKAELQSVVARYAARKAAKFAQYASLISELDQASNPDLITWIS